MLITPFLACLPVVLPQGDCSNSSTGLMPLTDLGQNLYLGQFQGGLYPGGLNLPPAVHAQEGEARGQALRPLDPDGAPSLNGRIGLVSIGMSTTSQEFCSDVSFPPCAPTSFMAKSSSNAGIDPRVVPINGAALGEVTSRWVSPTQANYDRIRDQWLMPAGMSELQVQVAWVKLSSINPTVSLPAPASDALIMLVELANVVRALRIRYPNLAQVFFSSRHYGAMA